MAEACSVVAGLVALVFMASVVMSISEAATRKFVRIEKLSYRTWKVTFTELGREKQAVGLSVWRYYPSGDMCSIGLMDWLTQRRKLAEWKEEGV